MEVVAEGTQTLAWRVDDRCAVLTWTGGGTARSAFHFQVDGPRLRVGLALPPRRRAIDVSLQPALVGHLVEPTTDGSSSLTIVGWVSAFAAAQGCWHPSRPTTVTTAVGGAAFPLLGAAYDRGATGLARVPRWAAPILVQATARAAAVAAFGAATSRRVIAALAASLVPASSEGAERPVTLYPLAVALMGRAVLDPDRLARVLSDVAAGPTRGDDVWPTREHIGLVGGLVAHLGPARGERILRDAASLPHGPQLLVRAAQTFSLVRHHLDGRLPNRIVELHDHLDALLPSDPSPHRPTLGALPPRARPRPTRPASPDPSPRRRRPQPPAPRPRPPVVVADDPPRRAAPPTDTARRNRALRAPAAGPGPAASTSIVYPPPVSALHTRDLGDGLSFVIPRTPAELERWSRQLHNCLDTYGPAAVTGRSWLIGVTCDDRLAACIEVEPTGVIRQFLAAGNRPVPERVARRVTRHLATTGVVDAAHPANRVWLTGTG